MAIQLLGTNNARISAGDVAAIAGETALSVAFTIRLISLATGSRFVTQWGGATGSQAFLIQLVDTDEAAYAISNAGGSYFSAKTTVLNLAAGGTYRMVFTWATGTPNTMTITVNGVAQATADFIGTTNIAAVINSATAVQVGHETDEAEDGIDGDYSEIAIWGAVLSASDRAAYGAGVAPPDLSASAADRILYIPAYSTTNLPTPDPWGGNTITQTGGTDAPHPGTAVAGADALMAWARRRRRRRLR